jgi:hypothetical protein
MQTESEVTGSTQTLLGFMFLVKSKNPKLPCFSILVLKAGIPPVKPSIIRTLPRCSLAVGICTYLHVGFTNDIII